MSFGIEVENLSLDYGDTRALDDMSFTIPSGTIVGLLGRNGSGKTSLVSVLAAFRRGSSGEVRVDGQDPFENAEIMANTCLIREGGDVADNERVSSVIDFAARHRLNWDAALADRLLDRFKLPRKKRVKSLSRGMRSALGVVLGMASRAPLTIFDEVHLGMDAPSRYAFYEELLNDYLEHPRTVILSTHLIEEVASLFEDVLIIDHGGVVMHEPTEDVRERGVAITGPIEAVDRFCEGMTVLNRQQLGGSGQVTTFGTMTDDRRREAKAAGLELGPVPLQDLFVHLTKDKEDRS
ncbi:MAG TPA: ABC transporter ATP-binding protein [Stackebrandtia sp.]|uniref:ABC transporter ATP-binding protein n=1 Tax=Stackebrandtia sp. TaxID=2023065 RepID=UPI002D5DE831|nr:ABC transporter ATP-binding protein [Stackebrandtia sp.]HZE37284.1 ABC transporter ATP-binding protein [Stackebrandtia sp.]